MAKLDKSLFLGFVAGASLSLLVFFLAHSTRPSPAPSPNKKMAVEGEGVSLTEEALRQKVSTELVPSENDEYQILRRGLENWLGDQLFEKEAKARGLGLNDLVTKEIWSRVRVSDREALEDYNRNRAAYPQSFEEVKEPILRQLRQAAYEKAKSDYLGQLKEKYKVKVGLAKPKSFVEGLALPSTAPKPAESAAIPGANGPSLPPPSRGPEGAPVTMIEFADFHCSYCKQVAPTVQKILQNYGDKIRLIFRHFPLSSTPGEGSFLTHEAAACAHEQGKFWEFYDKVFGLDHHPEAAEVDNLAQGMGLNMAQFKGCVSGHKYQSLLEKDRSDGAAQGVDGTPAFFINGQKVAGAYPYEYFANRIDSILNPGKANPAPAAPPPAPKFVTFNDLDGKPSLGPKDAPITLVEFSDFHCPYCQKVEPTLDQLMKNYPNKIQRVWRHYPLPMHQGSEHTHEASQCAAEQGKFWEYHDKLFASDSRDDATLLRLAAEIKLSKKKFGKCLTSGKYKDLIQKEISKGAEAGVQGTPAIFVNGQLVAGAYPYEYFSQMVQRELAKAKS